MHLEARDHREIPMVKLAVALVVNLALSGFQWLVFAMTGSAIMYFGALHDLGDAGSSLATIGLRLSSRRWPRALGLSVGLNLTIVLISSIVGGWQGMEALIFSGGAAPKIAAWPMIIVAGAGLVGNGWLHRYLSVSEAKDVRAHSLHFLDDFLTCGGVIVVVVLSSWLAAERLDPVVAIVVAALVIGRALAQMLGD